MKAGVLYPNEGIRIDNRQRPRPGPDGILVEVRSAGICGSDIHYYRDGHIGDWWVRQPHVLGHEFAGRIVALGANISGYSIGDAVAIEPIIPCEECVACVAGRYNLCLNLRFTGSPHTDGAFQDYVITRPRFTHPIPTGVPFWTAALAEPTSVAVHAVRRSGLRLGDRVAVIGAGPIGLLTIAVARASGAGTIVAFDLEENRLEAARQMGADRVQISSPAAASELSASTQSQDADIVFEAVGLPQTLENALAMVRPGGSLTVIGVNPEERIPFNLMLAQSKEVDIATVYLGRDAFPTALELLASKRVNPEPMLTHSYPLAQLSEALDTASQQRDQAIKVLINW